MHHFVGPDKDDGGIFYAQLIDAAYNGFLNGEEPIDRQRDFTVQSDFTNNPDVKFLSDQFSDLSDIPAS